MGIPTTRFVVQDLIKQDGPMTAQEIASVLKRDVRTIDSAIRLARQPGKPKLFKIVGYQRSTGTGGRWGAIYDVGAEDDAPEPFRDTPKKCNKRYRNKNRKLIVLRDRVRRHGPTVINHWLTLLGA